MPNCYDFRTIVEYFQGPSQMARTFETTTQAIWQWGKLGIPSQRRFEFEVRSHGRFLHDRVPVRGHNRMPFSADKASAKGSPWRGASID
jgi:hypothetical protein